VRCGSGPLPPKLPPPRPFTETITLTAGERHISFRDQRPMGMETPAGISKPAALGIAAGFARAGFAVEVHETLKDLPPGTRAAPRALDGAVVVVRGALASPDALYSEVARVPWDAKEKSYGRVGNLLTRHKITFTEEPREPDYEAGQGRHIAYAAAPRVTALVRDLEALVGYPLHVEGNRYLDPRTSNIGWHGDKERKTVIGARLGASFDLHFCWFLDNEPVGDVPRVKTLTLHHGDLYIMSQEACGFDSGHPSYPTLRHAAGPLVKCTAGGRPVIPGAPRPARKPRKTPGTAVKCAAETKKGDPCQNNAKGGSQYCGVHGA
jgi:alkylated DNA repair dioxygenase AlkB